MDALRSPTARNGGMDINKYSIIQTKAQAQRYRLFFYQHQFMGKLGYELYVPAEQAVHVDDRVVEAGNS